jgi:hypothetical protein
MFPLSIYVAVALAIALIAFGFAQIVPGLGAPFVALASMLWVAYSANRRRQMTRK